MGKRHVKLKIILGILAVLLIVLGSIYAYIRWYFHFPYLTTGTTYVVVGKEQIEEEEIAELPVLERQTVKAWTNEHDYTSYFVVEEIYEGSLLAYQPYKILCNQELFDLVQEGDQISGMFVVHQKNYWGRPIESKYDNGNDSLVITHMDYQEASTELYAVPD